MATTTMDAFAVDHYKPMGDISHFKKMTLPMPSDPTGHDILVEIKAIATNPIDYKKLANLGNIDAKLDEPLIVGYDASGIITKAGSDVTLFKVGDEVMFAGDITRPGTFAQYTLVDERITAIKPKNVSWTEAASFPLTSITAWEGMVDKLHVSTNKDDNNDKTILITAGAGGVGSIATQIAKNVFGLTVISTASRPETIEWTTKRGADHVISHRKPLKPQLEEIGIQSVDYIFHCSDLTPELFTELIDITKPFGGIVCISPFISVNLTELVWKAISFSAEFMFARPMTGVGIERQNEILTEVSKLVDEGVLTSAETKSFELTEENLLKVLEIQMSGKAIGKMTLGFV